jgi:hypothetical protein
MATATKATKQPDVIEEDPTSAAAVEAIGKQAGERKLGSGSFAVVDTQHVQIAEGSDLGKLIDAALDSDLGNGEFRILNEEVKGAEFEVARFRATHWRDLASNQGKNKFLAADGAQLKGSTLGAAAEEALKTLEAGRSEWIHINEGTDKDPEPSDQPVLQIEQGAEHVG